jgi:hypothetical protein
MVPIIYWVHGYAKTCVFRTIFSRTLVTKARVFLVLITMFRKKLHRLIFLKRMVSIIYLGNGVAKSCVFRKTFSTTLVTKVRVFLVLICKFKKKFAPFNFLETNGLNHLFTPWRRQKLCFQKNIFENLVTKGRVFFVLLFKFANK